MISRELPENLAIQLRRRFGCADAGTRRKFAALGLIGTPDHSLP
jgi:hypothetical protein